MLKPPDAVRKTSTVEEQATADRQSEDLETNLPPFVVSMLRPVDNKVSFCLDGKQLCYDKGLLVKFLDSINVISKSAFRRVARCVLKHIFSLCQIPSPMA